MKYLLIIIIIFLSNNTGRGHSKKSKAVIQQIDVLVIGGTAPGIGAALQSARKGLQTLLLVRGNRLGDDLDRLDTALRIGIPVEYLKGLESGEARDVILGQLVNQHKNLQIRYDQKIIAMSQTTEGWRVKLTDSSIIDSRAIVEIDKSIYSDYKKPSGFEDIALRNSLYGETARTAIGVPTRYEVMGDFPLGRFLSATKKNFVILPMGWGRGDFLIGQVAGAIANSFLNNKNKGIDVREVQAEMLALGSSILDFHDHERGHPHYNMFQRVLATGILSIIHTSNGTFFSPEEVVSVKQIKEGFTSYYPKSNLWFQSHSAGNLSIEDVLELFRFITNKGEALNLQIASDWKAKLELKKDFDLNRDISREEFAVLVDTYLNPFKIKVDVNGKIIID